MRLTSKQLAAADIHVPLEGYPSWFSYLFTTLYRNPEKKTIRELADIVTGNPIWRNSTGSSFEGAYEAMLGMNLIKHPKLRRKPNNPS
jgi:hypothetical protein